MHIYDFLEFYYVIVLSFNQLDFCVMQLGERVLPDIVPILERGLRSERPDQRQGVCIGLGEILASTSRDAVLSFADGLVSRLAGDYLAVHPKIIWYNCLLILGPQEVLRCL